MHCSSISNEKNFSVGMSSPWTFKEFLSNHLRTDQREAFFPFKQKRKTGEKFQNVFFFYSKQKKICFSDVQNLEKGESLQDDYACASSGEKVGTKYGYIKFWFWKDSKIQHLHMKFQNRVNRQKKISFDNCHTSIKSRM